jgi:hypothetical protein
MAGLPSELYTRCRDTLLACSEFDSDAALRALFVTTELAPFQNGLPDAASKNARVDACLAYLLPKRLNDGRPLLPLFLATLRDRYPAGDAMRDDIDALHHAVRSALPGSGTSHAPGPGPAGETAWNTSAIRDLLTAAFSDEELTTLCFDKFPSVYEDLSSGMSKGQKIQRLLGHCRRHQGFDTLVSLVRERNPAQYAQFERHLRRTSH